MAAPTMANNNNNNNSAVANGNTSASNHERKPSMSINSSGASTHMPNGSSAPSSNRLSVTFGSMPAGDSSPAPAPNTTPSQTPNASLSAPRTDPRVTSPANSPSPIPIPSASGGRPPANLPSQGNGPTFGGMSEGEANRQGPNGMQGTPVMPGQHFRRASSQSQHSDISQSGPPGAGRGGFVPGAGRGRNFGGYPQQMPYSPQQPFRQIPGQPPRPGAGMPPHFQNQMHMGPHPGSPHQPPRSPGMPGSQPHTPHMQPMQMNGQHMNFMPQYGGYGGQMQPQPGQFAGQPGFDPNYNYYQQPYPMHPQYLHQGPPPSPRPFNQMPPGGRQSFGQSQYQQPPSTAMSRTSSAMSERPSSSIGHPGQSGTPGPHQSSHTPSQSSSSIVPPPSSANFVRPNREKKAIVIKNADGDVITFDKKQAVAKSTSPAPPPSSTATPPPRPDSTASHQRNESKTGKTAEEIKAEFQAQVRRGQQEEKLSEEPASKPASTASETTKGADSQETPAEQLKEASDSASAQKDAAAEKAEAAADSKAEAEKTEAATAPSAVNAETEEERKKREAEEEEERMIAEMEALEREEEERERAFQEKRKKEIAEKAQKEKEAANNADDEMKRLEREAEAAEEARQQGKTQDDESEEAKLERQNLFDSLKKPSLGPAASESTGQEESGVATPASESSPVPTHAKPTSSKRPAPLKVETNKPIEPPQPTPGMQSLRSARLLQLQNEAATIYPDGIKSPNPALNEGTKRAGMVYDKDFLLQFQSVFKEKPVVDWDQKLRETVGDGSESAKSARTPSTARIPSSRGAPQQAFSGMGNFAAGQRTIPPGTTSAERFAAASSGRQIPGPLGAFAGGRPPSFPNMGQIGGGRSATSGPMRNQSGRQASKTESRRGPQNRRENEQANKSMPLTAGQAVKELEQSTTGWKPPSVGRSAIAGATTDATGQMPPDMVQRKVKSALNKMTPERFDKLSEEILRIAAQSKNESDGRTLRQVIALTFEKACDESHWASMYAKFCQRMLSDMTNEVKDDTVLDKSGNPIVGGNLFRKYLLNRCQEEFERGWQTAMPPKPEGVTEEAAMMSDEYYEAAAVKRKGLGLVQFIGELYKLSMLSTKIMHECFNRLLNFEGLPDDSTIESLVKLLRTVGETMERSGAQGETLVNMYFDRIRQIMDMPDLLSRPHFMLLDLLDLRRQGWKFKGDKGPKTIQQIHAEAEAAQQAAELEKARQKQHRPLAGRGDARGFSSGPMPPPDTSNIVRSDDFHRLRNRGNAASRQASGPGASGPGGRLGSTGLGPRTASGRLGPPSMLSRTPDSGSSSRRDSQKGATEEDKSKTSLNSFDALANLEDDSKSPASSPPVTKAQPVVGEAGKNEEAKPSDS